jgi:putative FmdB family regulatory protein
VDETCQGKFNSTPIVQGLVKPAPLFSPRFFMPVYEFSCSNGCENFEVWRSIDQRQANTECPGCGVKGQRIFSPPLTLSGPLRLRIESNEPKIVRKQINDPSKPRLKEAGGGARPWMLNRGC